MGREARLATLTVGVLWLGKLLPRADEDVLTWAVGGYLILLGVWTIALGARAGTGEADPLQGWRGTFLPLGLALGVLAFVASAIGYTVSQRVLHLSPPSEARLVAGFDLRFGLVTGVALASALLEEWVFRGVLLDRLGSVPAAGAVAASALVFAAYHLSTFQLLPTFVLGVVLALVVRRAGSLWPAIVAHATFNVMGLLLTTLAAGNGGPR
ncbi:MAG: CPBP family intramembrane metalloprotease [Gemmatimonadota bacterium]|jgi:membrane protease YdiL (CAAX protease family)